MIDRDALVAGLAVGISYALVRSRRAQEWDRRAGAALSRPLGPVGDRVISAATDLGSVYAITGLSTTLFVVGRRRAAVDAFGSGMTAWVVAQAIKPLVDRPRPYQADEVFRLVAEPTGASWPSGHVAVAAALSSTTADRLPRGGRWTAAVTALFVAFSRVYVGVHYLSDVVAGAGIGVLSHGMWRRIAAWIARRSDLVS